MGSRPRTSVMAYQVTKRIRGRDYGYLVDCYRDPITGSRRSRWRTIRSRKRVGRLLEHRDPRNLTVGVIVKEACASHSTFYRHFPDRTSAIRAGLKQICGHMISDPEQLAREIKELLMIEAAEYSRIVAIIQRAVFGASCSDTSSFR